MTDTLTEQLDAVSEHRQAADRLVAKVINRAEGAGFAISSEIRREALAAARKLIARASDDPFGQNRFLADFLALFRAILRRYEGVLARTVSDANLAAWLEGGSSVLRTVESQETRDESHQGVESREPRDESQNSDHLALDSGLLTLDSPIVRYAIIEEAAADLRRLRPEQFAARADAGERGFSIARQMSLDALEKVRDALVDAVVDGDALRTFKAKIAGAIDVSRLSPHKQEMMFRNVLQFSYARGQKAVVEHPMVRSAAVFAWRANISDSRCTELCQLLSRSGIQGTGIYFVGDPVWRRVAPSSHPGCRCGVVYMPVKRAAEKGILVAQKWLETGLRPSDYDLFVPMPDLSALPERERVQFEGWVSPWMETAA